MTNEGSGGGGRGWGDPWDQGPCVIECFVLCLHVSVLLVLCFMLSPASLSVSPSLSVSLWCVCGRIYSIVSHGQVLADEIQCFCLVLLHFIKLIPSATIIYLCYQSALSVASFLSV